MTLPFEKRLELLEYHIQNYEKDVAKYHELHGAEDGMTLYMEGCLWGLKLAKKCIKDEPYEV